MNEQEHILFSIENEGYVDIYTLAPGVRISFNQINTDSWTKGDSSIYADEMLVLNFCLAGRCDVSLAQNRYTIVKERQICASTILPTKDFYYPGRKYEGVQLYIDLEQVRIAGDEHFLAMLGVDICQMAEWFCGKDGVYLHRMDDAMLSLVKNAWMQKEEVELGQLRYLTVCILHEWMHMSNESETELYFTRSQIAIVKEAEAMILQDLTKRFTAKDLAERFGISESSFKLYVKGILGDSYLSYFRRKRMEKAAELLESTNLKVIEIANTVGYENQGKFAKVFAECYGVSPLEFRRLSK